MYIMEIDLIIMWSISKGMGAQLEPLSLHFGVHNWELVSMEIKLDANSNCM